MKNKRKPISVYDVAVPLTPEEMQENEWACKMRIYLGIYPYLDGRRSKYDDHEAIVPSNYKTLDQYEDDKEFAENCIFWHKEIPQDMVNRLVTARKELEALGVIY